MKNTIRYRTIVTLAIVEAFFLEQGAAFGRTIAQPTPPQAESKPSDPQPIKTDDHAHMMQATADILAKSGSKLEGKAIFTQVGNRLHIIVQLDKILPGSYGVHIHEIGDCSAPDAMSAGEHFNPTNEKHGNPSEVHRHAGDLGNINIKNKGKGVLEISTDQLSLGNDTKNSADIKNSILGKSIVIHERMDDFITQPSGNSGKRIGCGVIQLTTAVPPAASRTESPQR